MARRPLRRLAMSLLALAAAAPVAGAGCKDPPRRDGATAGSGSARDAGGLAIDAAPAPPPDLSFVRGTLYLAGAEGHHHVRPFALDAATAAWRELGSGEASLFPSAHALRGGVLVIATEGESEADHVEQLAIVRGEEVERFGPRAGLVRHPAVAADGTVVVETSEHGFRDLYRIDPRGKVVRLTQNREGNFEPSLSPDAAHVVFSSSRDGDAEVYRLPVAGGKATRLTAFHKDDWSPQWSPAGDLIAFLSDREGPPRLFLMAPDGTGQRRATGETDPDIAEDVPRWSPDGRALLFARTTGAAQALALLDPATSGVRGLTPAGSSDTDATWSPDGTHLAVLRHPLSPARTLGPAAIVLLRVADGHEVARLPAPAEPRYLRWLP